ncbi:MAG: hypothetical protein AAF567_09990 [Actinomycetota bacterium]
MVQDLTPRTMWEAVERYHQLCYWAPEVRETGTAAGLKGFWMNYFATRAAPLGVVPAEAVESLFFYYAPHRVHRAIPDAWTFADPAEILQARYRGMDQALRRELAEHVEAPEVRAALTIVRAAVDAAPAMGRTLGAAWRALPWPEPDHLALWHGCTVLRELRSGSHLIALAAANLDGCESVVSQVAADEAPIAWIEEEAGWSADEAAAARERLQRRGWLDDAGWATDAGRAGRQAIEAMTDELDRRHWESIGDDACRALLDALGVLNEHLPKDDQLDWQDIYGPNRATGE